MRIDHVIYATTDLDEAAARLERELGLKAVGGGRHDGMGTHNTIVPLGNGYIEILAIADPQEAASSPLGRAVTGRIAAQGDGLMGWAVAVDDVDETAGRIESTISTIGRQGMTARLTGVVEAMEEPCLPFFIERDPGVADPGGGGAEGIAWIEVAGEPERIGPWIGGLGSLPVRITAGPPAVIAVGIGDRELR
jgi:catechol 2,3-dioxygenase-like lactoylglutathione lyase family enzyme